MVGSRFLCQEKWHIHFEIVSIEINHHGHDCGARHSLQLPEPFGVPSASGFWRTSWLQRHSRAYVLCSSNGSGKHNTDLDWWASRLGWAVVDDDIHYQCHLKSSTLDPYTLTQTDTPQERQRRKEIQGKTETVEKTDKKILWETFRHTKIRTELRWQGIPLYYLRWDWKWNACTRHQWWSSSSKYGADHVW